MIDRSQHIYNKRCGQGVEGQGAWPLVWPVTPFQCIAIGSGSRYASAAVGTTRPAMIRPGNPSGYLSISPPPLEHHSHLAGADALLARLGTQLTAQPPQAHPVWGVRAP